jgi:hypothetical protein
MKTWYIAALVIIGLIVAGIAYTMYEKKADPYPTFVRHLYGEKWGKPVYGPTRKTWKKADWGDVKTYNFDDL